MYLARVCKTLATLALVIVVSFSTISARAQQPTADVPAESPDAHALRISAGDLVEVRVYGVEEMKRETRVSSSGEISMPLVGTLSVAGRTPQDAEKYIAQKLVDAGLLKNPQVTVFIKEYATQGVSVLGEVQKPGVYPALGARRLFDLISAAGGLSNKAGRDVNITHRDHPTEPVTVQMSDDPVVSAKSNVEVYPGDTIMVAKAGIVYVVGDVGKPGGFVMENNNRLTVLQAVALAQGANRTASLKSAKVIRRTPTGVTEIPIALNRIMAAKVPDQPLQNEDIVFVPNSAARSAGRRGIEAILQTATGLAIYRPF